MILTAQGVRNLGLETVTVQEAAFETTTFALGRTETIPESHSVLGSRISGRVVESRLKLGSTVTKDEKLVLIESRQPGNPSPMIWLTAPADGTVISIDTSLGAPVEPSDRLAEFADLKRIYLIATMPQAVAGKLKQGTQARIHFPLHPDKKYVATLLRSAVCPCPDPACTLNQMVTTRSGKSEGANLNTVGVVFIIDNPENQLRPGMSAECSIIVEKRDGVLSVPREAVQGGPSNRHVYVKHPSIPDAFERVSVHTGLFSNDRVEVIDGLFPGDSVVTRGSYSLGFSGSSGGPSLKDAMDAVHGHEHNEDGSEKAAGHDSGAASGEGETHGHESRPTSVREIFFMACSGILAVLLVVAVLYRRHPSTSTANHS